MNPIAGLIIILLDCVAGPIIVAAFLIMMTIAAMKNNGSIAKKAFIVLLVYVLLAVTINIYMLYFWNPSPYRNKKADDAISRAIYEATGGKEIYYQEKDISSEGVTHYEYIFYKENEGQLEKMLKAADAVIQQDKICAKISITCRVMIFSHGSEFALSLDNYSDAELENADYPSLQYLWINGGSVNHTTIYNIPETYRGLQGIKYLKLSEIGRAHV